MKHKTATTLWGYAFLLPRLIGLLVFSFIPLVVSFGLSLSRWDLISAPVFVGINNFIAQFNHEIFLKTITNTLLFVAIIVPLRFLVSLTLAMCVNKVFGKIFFRVVFFLPVMMSGVVVSLIWMWMLNKDFGIVNYFLYLLNISPVDWLETTTMAVISISVVTVWGQCGYDMVIYLAGLQSISGSLYEAADIDGAKPWQKLLHITLPMLTPTIYLMLTISLINVFQTFDRVLVMTEGGPMNSTRTIVYDIYFNAFRYGKFGNAAASSIILFAMIMVVTLIQNYGSKKWVHYDAE